MVGGKVVGLVVLSSILLVYGMCLAGENLLVNGGLEEPYIDGIASGWQKIDSENRMATLQEKSDLPKETQGKSAQRAKTTTEKGVTGVIYQGVTLEADKEYQLELWYKLVSREETEWRHQEARIAGYSGENRFIKSIEFTSDTWKKESIRFKAPFSGGYEVHIMSLQWGVADIIVDDVSLRECSTGGE